MIYNEKQPGIAEIVLKTGKNRKTNMKVDKSPQKQHKINIKTTKTTHV